MSLVNFLEFPTDGLLYTLLCTVLYLTPNISSSVLRTLRSGILLHTND